MSFDHSSATKVRRRIVYKIVYPNGKIYVGKDLTNNINYFGSADADWMARDFDETERRSFSVTRQILWESEETSDAEAAKLELHFIRMLRSNDPDIGYNRWPRVKGREVKAVVGEPV